MPTCSRLSLALLALSVAGLACSDGSIEPGEPGEPAADAGPGGDMKPGETPDAASPDVGTPESPPDAGGDRPPPEWTYDPSKPLSTELPGLAPVTHNLQPTGLWGDHRAPYPTNIGWSNLVLGNGNERINLLPYHVRGLADGVAVALPKSTSAALSVTTSAEVHLTLGAVQAFTGHALASNDLFSATLAWRSGSGSMTAPLVYGMPYVTARYAALTPKISTGGPAITNVNGGTAATVTGTRFEVAMNNAQTWVIYSSAPITFTREATALTGTQSFTGDIRIAMISSPAAAAVLDAHAGAIPTGATLGAKVDKDVADVTFTWKVDGTGPLLMMALPHQRERLVEPMTSEHKVATLFGEMTAVVGATWTLRYPLPTVGFDAPTPIAAAKKAELEAALTEDASYEPEPLVVGTDPYFGGKQLAKLARLSLIARELGRSDLATALAARIEPYLNAWLDGTNANPLLYDQTWGGIITTRGHGDPNADFGQGNYNDHHFHYGYLVYAAAVVARENPSWAAAHDGKVIALLRDIMNPSALDPHFTPFRHFDFFAGHSWAAGLFVFGDGRNQESTSEAVNAWYAAELYGLATGNAEVFHLGRVLLAMEIASARYYWQVRDDVPVYPSPFREFHAVGVLWQTKVDAVTFFGMDPAFVYGIQMIPFTPVSEALLDPAWITNAWPQMSVAAAATTESWRGLLHMAHALIAPDAAWADLGRLTAYDDGNSKTNTLYWAATR